jgi:AP-1 complex subunit gamma-1
LDVEVQQRAVEFGNLFTYDQIRRGVLEKMPAPQIKEESRVLGEAAKKSTKASNRKSKAIKPKEEDLLFDLMGDSSAAAPSSPVNGSQNNTDLLADILGGTSSPPPTTTSPPPGSSNVASIMDLFSQGPVSTPSPAQGAPHAPPPSADLFSTATSPPPQPAAAPAAAAYHACYDNNGLNVTIQTQRNAEGTIQATARFRNSAAPLAAVGLQAAVPKSQKLQLLSISSTELAVGQEAMQMMRVAGCKGVSSFLFFLSYQKNATKQNCVPLLTSELL